MGKYLVSILFVVTLVARSAALGQGVDIAIVSLVSGDATYVPQGGTRDKVQPFIKVRSGDRFDVAAGGQVRIVFFEGARQEFWAGPASFRAGKAGAEPISGKAAETTNLPLGVPQRLAQIPALIKNSTMGGTHLRGRFMQPKGPNPDEQATLAQARAIYKKLREDMPADDITPELYLYAALNDFLAYDEMKVVVTEMKRKQPDNEDVRVFDRWLTGRLSH